MTGARTGHTVARISRIKRDPLSVPINTDRAFVLYYYGKNDEALRSIRLALEMRPNYAGAYFWLNWIYTCGSRIANSRADSRIGQRCVAPGVRPTLTRA